MIYNVEINYRKGPSFSCRVRSNCAEVAKLEAKHAAKQWGFTEKVKKMIVRKEQ